MEIVIVLIPFIILLIIGIHLFNTNKMINEYFNRGNVIVFGAKGKGKDLLFQKRIVLNKKKKYHSNIDYGYSGTIRTIHTLTVAPNTYEEFINGNITKINKINNYEKIDYFLSDAGVFLPCQYDYLLHKKYPSFPIYYALSRHLYDSNIHCNCQALSRVWKAVREQADGFIKCLKVLKVPGILICKIRFYDKYESALNNLLPLKARLLNKYSKATADQYYSTNGEIKERYYILLKKDIKYDTRHFEKILFNEETIERRKNNNGK